MNSSFSSLRKTWSATAFPLAARRLGDWHRLGFMLLLLASIAQNAAGATLVGQYHFEESGWGSVLDSSGGNHHGTAVGSPLPVPVTTAPALPGATGTCGNGSFAGGSGALAMPGLPVSLAPGAQTSVSFWMYWDGTNSVMPIGWQRHDLWLASGRFGFNTANSDIYGISSTGLAGGWHHVVAMFTNGNVTGNSLYIDGVAKVLTQQQGTPNNASAIVDSTLRVSGWGYDTNYKFGGRIDEVKVYNGALTAGEVTTLFNETHPCPALPVAEWHLDELTWTGTTGEVADSSGNSLHGTASAGAITASAKVCNGGSLSSQAYVEVADNASLRLTPAYTLAAWVKTTKSTGTIVSKTATSSPWPGYVFAIGPNSGGKLALWNGTGSWYVSSGAAVNDGAWHHVAASVNGTSLQFYVDGAANGAPIVLAGVTGIATAPLRIGLENESGAASRYFSGQIDEVIIFNAALSAAEIAAGHANQNAGRDWYGATRSCPALIAQYRFEDGSAAWNGTAGELKDTAGYAGGPFNGQAIGTPVPSPASTSPAKPGASGTCGYATMPGPSANGGAFSVSGLPVSLAAGAKTSVSFWMYWNGTDSVMPIGWNLHDLWLQNNRFGFNTASSDIYGISSAGLTGGWHHVVAVFTNGSVTSNEIYVDGTARVLSQQQSSPNNGNATVSTTLRIGGWQANTSYRFAGRIDEVKVFSGGMTQAQVTSLYNETHSCGVPIAEYHLDETSWAGTVGEVADSSGNGLHGTARAGAITASAKVCRGGTLASQAYVEVADNASLRLTPAYTLAAWVKTTKSTGTIVSKTATSSPWPGYVFAIGPDSGGKLALWNGTGSWYVSSGAAVNDGAWHHVAASVNGTSLQFYVDGAANGAPIVLAGVTGIATTPLRIGLENEPGAASRYFNGQIDEVIIFNAALSAAEIAAGVANQNAGKNWNGSARACPGGGVVPSRFNCVESGAAASTGHLYTKLAGTAFTFDVAALRNDGSLETDYASDANKNLTVELGVASDAACTGWTALSPPVSQALVFTAANAGRKAAAATTVANAYPDLRCRVTDANQAPNIVVCSSDNFSARPTGLVVTASANADAAGASTSATPAIKTGANFTLTASAVAGYNGTPQLNPGMVAAHSGAIQTGTVAGSFGGANPATGAATGAAFTYSEVGYFNLTMNGVYDNMFTAVDSAVGDCTDDFSNAPVGGKYGCKFGNSVATSYFGRFVPDHFALIPGSYIDRADINTGGSEALCASAFTYMGEDFKTTFTLVAQNSVNAITQNYTGGHDKYVLTVWNNFAFNGSSGALVQGSVAPAGVWSSTAGSYGTAAVTTTHRVTRPAAPVAPYANFSVSALPSYTDGAATIALAASTAVHPGTSELRYGILKLDNAYGSELLPLRVPLRAMYWNTSSWATNTLDACTALPNQRDNLAIGNHQGTLTVANYGSSKVPSAALTLASGTGTIILAVPAAGTTGSVDIALNLTATLTDVSCNPIHPATISGANLPWLQGNWCGAAGYVRDPGARIKFGSPKAPYIYMRERY